MKMEFGGNWTEEKLTCLRKYLEAYTRIFDKNPNARYFITTYVDAFAGTGYRSIDTQTISDPSLFEIDDAEGQDYAKGSARIALDVSPSFQHYVFIDKNAFHIDELEKLKLEYPDKSNKIHIWRGDANTLLLKWCKETDWRKNRAVVFLDPYGMQVNWDTVEAIANTHAIDLWWLIPLGMAINRMLTTDSMPKPEWADRLTKTFGSDTWRDEFYKRETVPTLFGDEERLCKDAGFDAIGNYVIKRLSTIFYEVCKEPLYLCNSRNNPLFILCFAAGNQKGAAKAVKIAGDILKVSRRK